jgi:hypothetical protein
VVPASVLIPSAAASSIAANSDTSGAPSPATGIAWSSKNPWFAGSPSTSSGSTSLSTAHSTVNRSFSPSARRISAAVDRSPDSTAAVLSVAGSAVVVIEESKHRPPTAMARFPA